jgi:DNA-binding beta-propeller fold protein YncE
MFLLLRPKPTFTRCLSSRHWVQVLFTVCAALSGRTFAGPTPELLIPGPAIQVPGSKGKYDFLEIDVLNRRLLGSHTQDGTLDVFDLKTERLLSRVATGAAQDSATDSGANAYYVSVSKQTKVAFVDATTMAITKTVTTDGELDGIAFDPKHRLIFAGHDDGTELWVIDADSAKLVGTVVIPGPPEYLLYDAVSDRIYLNIKTTDEIVVIDPESKKIVAHWPTAPAKGPHGLALDATTRRLFSAGNNGQLAVVDVSTGRVISSVAIAQKVDQIAFDAGLKRVYCAGSGVFSVVQETPEGAVLLGDVQTVPSAKNVVVDPQTHAVWTTYTDGQNAFARSWLLP